MNPQTFFEHFERLTDAPQSVARLRELILQLAVQGKLVAQDERDEPATRLFERIVAERKRLVRDKKLKEAKPLPPVSDDETPFEIPDSWRWVTLDSISSDVHYGYTASANQSLTDVRLLRITDIQNGKVNWDSVPGCDIDEHTLPSFKLNNSDILIARTGGTIGKSYLVEDLSLCAVFASYLIRVIPTNLSFPPYTKLFLDSDLYWTQLRAKSMGTGQPNVNATSLKSLRLPFPPFEEQGHIVAKVDELMRLCDELERTQAERREARWRLNRTALDRLLTARDAAEFQTRWQTVADHFPTLTTASDQIGKLRQAILQLAVQGKLSQQDPKDEPAPVLLRRIRAERERLIKENRLKRADPLPPVNPDETPFALPNNWMWVRLGDFGGFWGGGTPSKSNPEFWQGSIPWVSPKDMKRLYLSDSIDHITDEAVKQSTAQLIPQNSLLLVVRGMILAHSFPVALTLRDVTINQDMKALQLVSPDIAEFLLLACRGLKYEMLKKVVRSSHGTCRLESGDVECFSIPLPPLEEQKRIVATVNRLMTLCDELESGLHRSEEDGERLLRAAVRSLLAPAADNSMRLPALA